MIWLTTGGQERPSWAPSPMSGGQWRPSDMSCPYLAVAGEAVVGT